MVGNTNLELRRAIRPEIKCWVSLVSRWHLKSWSRTRPGVDWGESDPRTEPSHLSVNRLRDEEEPAKETKKSSNVVLGKPSKKMFQEEGSDQICPMLLMGQEK